MTTQAKTKIVNNVIRFPLVKRKTTTDDPYHGFATIDELHEHVTTIDFAKFYGVNYEEELGDEIRVEMLERGDSGIPEWSTAPYLLRVIPSRAAVTYYEVLGKDELKLVAMIPVIR